MCDLSRNGFRACDLTRIGFRACECEHYHYEEHEEYVYEG